MQCYRQKENGMYILSRSEIEKIATEKLQEFSPSNLERPIPLETTRFLEDYLGLIIKYKYIGDFQSGILGLTVMGDELLVPSYDELLRPVVLEETFGTVLISPVLRGLDNTARRRYTKMHEGAHFILHQPYFANCEKAAATTKCKYPCNFVACRKIGLFNEKLKTDSDWIEYQADALAAALLMPQNVFQSYVRDVLRKNGIRSNYLQTNPQINDRKAHSVIYDVAETFAVSYQATKIRMTHLGLLKESNLTY